MFYFFFFSEKLKFHAEISISVFVYFIYFDAKSQSPEGHRFDAGSTRLKLSSVKDATGNMFI